MMWEYRESRSRRPRLYRWGRDTGGRGVPRLAAALAMVHAREGRAPWKELLQPAIEMARCASDLIILVALCKIILIF